MATLITDAELEASLQADRQATGADRFDEVWEGVYMMAPMPNDEHQQIVMLLSAIFQEVIGWSGAGDVRPGVNVSDRADAWQQNYRVPDIAVFLAGGRAQNRGAFWLGGPDFVVEIISPEDRSRDKLAFYQQIRTREVMLVDRHPWCLELYRGGEKLQQVGRVTADDNTTLGSDVLPLEFQLLSAARRPQIQVKHTESDREWLV